MDDDAQLLALLTAHNTGQPLPAVPPAPAAPQSSGPAPPSVKVDLDVDNLPPEDLELLLGSLEGTAAASTDSNSEAQKHHEDPADIIQALQKELATAPVAEHTYVAVVGPPGAPGAQHQVQVAAGGQQFQAVAGQYRPAPQTHAHHVPARQRRISPRPRHSSADASEEDEAKIMEKNRIREENRERKKRWRETNTDRSMSPILFIL